MVWAIPPIGNFAPGSPGAPQFRKRGPGGFAIALWICREDIARITAVVEQDPAVELTLDLVDRKIHFGGKSVPLTLRDSARDALINGRWDPIGELLEGREAVAATASRLPYLAPVKK